MGRTCDPGNPGKTIRMAGTQNCVRRCTRQERKVEDRGGDFGGSHKTNSYRKKYTLGGDQTGSLNCERKWRQQSQPNFPHVIVSRTLN